MTSQFSTESTSKMPKEAYTIEIRDAKEFTLGITSFDGIDNLSCNKY